MDSLLPISAFKHLNFLAREIPLADDSIPFERAVFSDGDVTYVVMRDAQSPGMRTSELSRYCEGAMNACALELKLLKAQRGALRFFQAVPARVGSEILWTLFEVQPLLNDGHAVFARWMPLSREEQDALLRASHLATANTRPTPPLPTALSPMRQG